MANFFMLSAYLPWRSASARAEWYAGLRAALFNSSPLYQGKAPPCEGLRGGRHHAASAFFIPVCHVAIVHVDSMAACRLRERVREIHAAQADQDIKRVERVVLGRAA